MDANLVDLSVKESVPQFNLQDKVDVGNWTTCSNPAVIIALRKMIANGWRLIVSSLTKMQSPPW